MYIFLSGLGLLVIVGLHQLLESRKVITTGRGCGSGRVGVYLCTMVRCLPPRIHLLLLLSPSQRRRPAPKVEMGTTSHNDVDLSWIPQETLNQISTYTTRPRSPLTSDP